MLYVTAAGNRLAMLDADGMLALSHNWTKPGWVDSHGGLSGVIADDGTGLEGAAPGFVDEGLQDFHLLEASPAVDAGTALAPAVLPDHAPLWQYREHQLQEPRFDDGAPDLGALELPEPGVGWGLAAGLAALGALSRRRSARSAPTYPMLEPELRSESGRVGGMQRTDRLLTACLLVALGLLASVASAEAPSAPAAAVAAPDRSDADRALDAGRFPAETLAFFGIRPGMRVAELGAGGGYTTELLARVVGPTGRVYGQNPKFILERFAEKPWSERLAKPVNARVVRVDREFDDPLPPEARDLDAVLIVLFYHDTVWLEADRARMNARGLRRAEEAAASTA